jgi:glycosyltransferase involved in cell wall biosynthesis
MCVYNDALFIRECLESIEPVLDEIVIVEGSWHGGVYDAGGNFRSDDGTREIVEEFQQKHLDKVILLDSLGDEAVSRNITLTWATHDWCLELSSDEFYDIETLRKVKESLDDNTPETIFFTENVYYFNFNFIMRGLRPRLYNAKGRTYFEANGCGDHWIEVTGECLNCTEVMMHHLQWIGNRDKVIKTKNIDRQEKQINKDTRHVRGSWKWWLHEIYLQFNGHNLKELEAKNGGTIHPWGWIEANLKGKPLDSPLYKVSQDKLPDSITSAPWYDPLEEGIVDFKRGKYAS